MAKLKSFDEVLKAAIEDISQNGFDTAERLAFWEEQLRRAARASMTPIEDMEKYLKEALTDAWNRDIKAGKVYSRHPGVSRFTIDKIKPQLRRELDKRILASANLIKLDRDRVINETLQRFSGWATSIPEGGSKAVNKKEEKETVRKGLSGLEFKARRVIIDQTHKLNGAINNIVAVNGGAIAAIWKSHYHQVGYDYREEHKEREIESTKKPYLIKDSWAASQGLVKLDGSKWLSDMTQPGEQIFCRCFLNYIYVLSDLPDSMLTVKGKEKLAEVRRKMADARL